MGQRNNTVTSPTYIVWDTSSQLISANDAFQEVVNAYPTEEGGYRNIVSGTPYMLNTSNATPSSAETASVTFPTYGPCHGIHHCYINNKEREVLLLHTGDQIWVMEHWNHAWKALLGPNSTTPQLQWEAPDPKTNRWPTQFVTTPTGVVIIPSNGSVYWYDGFIVAPLGFRNPPNAPIGLGPESTTHSIEYPSSAIPNPWESGVNDGGYSHFNQRYIDDDMDGYLGKARVGTIAQFDMSSTADEPANESGYLLPGTWRCKQAWVDAWGNVSPLSDESNDVNCDREPSIRFENSSPYHAWANVGTVRFQIGWAGISNGPPHVIGKILFRTKDLENSGDSRFYFLPSQAQVADGSFATIPDRLSKFYPDNIPDAWLVAEAPELVATPRARLGALAFGRLWLANFQGEPGHMRASEVGRWGTWPREWLFSPDPKGGEITGLLAVPWGLMAFTESSTFLLVASDDGRGVRPQTISSTVGCVAPSSIAMTRFGVVVWLGQDGFYSWDGTGQPQFLMNQHRQVAREINWARAERAVGYFDPRSGQYQCWVPMGSAIENNRRFKWAGGNSWHWDTLGSDFSDFTVTEDHRSLLIGCKRGSSAYAVNVMDAGRASFGNMRLNTGWMNSTDSRTKKTIKRIHFWMRETDSGNEFYVDVRRNYRAEVIQTSRVTCYPAVSPKLLGLKRSAHTDIEANPSFWNEAVGSTLKARRRRPFWASVDVDLSHTETFQIEVYSRAGVEFAAQKIEILGIAFDVASSDDGGASNRRD